MKKILLLAVFALGALAVCAQNVGGGRNYGGTDVPKGWNTIYVEWNPITVHHSITKSNFSANAFSFGFNHAFDLSSTIPIYLETGIAAQYTFRGYDEHIGVKMISLKVPANIIYNWNIPSSFVELMPFIGISLKGNLWGEGNDYDEYDREDYSWNLFSKDDMLDPWKRVQLGWQIGVKVRFSEKFVIGGSYGSDFMEICKKSKMRTGTIMMGLTF